MADDKKDKKQPDPEDPIAELKHQEGKARDELGYNDIQAQHKIAKPKDPKPAAERPRFGDMRRQLPVAYLPEEIEAINRALVYNVECELCASGQPCEDQATHAREGLFCRLADISDNILCLMDARHSVLESGGATADTVDIAILQHVSEMGVIHNILMKWRLLGNV